MTVTVCNGALTVGDAALGGKCDSHKTPALAWRACQEGSDLTAVFWKRCWWMSSGRLYRRGCKNNKREIQRRCADASKPPHGERHGRRLPVPPGDLQVQLDRPEVVDIHGEGLRKRAEQVQHFAGHAAHHHMIGQALQLRHLGEQRKHRGERRAGEGFRKPNVCDRFNMFFFLRMNTTEYHNHPSLASLICPF